MVLVASLGLVAALLPGHPEGTAIARPKTPSRPKTVSPPTKDPRSSATAEQVAEQVAVPVVLGTSPPSRDVTGALEKTLQTRPAAPLDLGPGTASVSTVSVAAAGTDGSEQLFEVVVTPLGAGPVPVDVVVVETDGRPRVAALPGIAN